MRKTHTTVQKSHGQVCIQAFLNHAFSAWLILCFLPIYNELRRGQFNRGGLEPELNGELNVECSSTQIVSAGIRMRSFDSQVFTAADDQRNRIKLLKCLGVILLKLRTL
jgi:hypothetical protein